MEKKKLKVLTIVNSLNMGGIEKTLLSCIEKFDKEQFEMTVCCFKKAGVLENEFKQNNVKIVYIKKTGLIFFDFLQLFLLLLKKPHHIIHSRFGFTSGGFVLAALLSNLPIIVSIHSTNPSFINNYKKNIIVFSMLKLHLKIHHLFTLKFATRIIGHSKANLDHNYKNWNQNKKFSVIYNGINFSKIDEDINESNELNKFIKDEDFVLLHIGSFRREKNHIFLLNCFKKILSNHSKCKLILVGHGSLEDEIRNKIFELNLENNIFLAGYDFNIKKYFQKSNIFVLPSLIEGFGNVIIESQYQKIPVCASDLPALRESVHKGYQSYFFNPYSELDFIEKINKMIEKIKENRFEREKDEAKLFVLNKFSINSMVYNLENIYRFHSKN